MVGKWKGQRQGKGIGSNNGKIDGAQLEQAGTGNSRSIPQTKHKGSDMNLGDQGLNLTP